MRTAVVIRQRLDFAPRGLRVIKVVARSRVAGFANSDSSKRAMTGGGRTERKAGPVPEGAQQEPTRQTQGRGCAGHKARRRHRAQGRGLAGHKARRRHSFRSLSAGKEEARQSVISFC